MGIRQWQGLRGPQSHWRRPHCCRVVAAILLSCGSSRTPSSLPCHSGLQAQAGPPPFASAFRSGSAGLPSLPGLWGAPALPLPLAPADYSWLPGRDGDSYRDNPVLKADFPRGLT